MFSGYDRMTDLSEIFSTCFGQQNVGKSTLKVSICYKTNTLLQF